MPLSNHRVLELGDLPAASYAARLLADFGAEVIKIETPAGQAARRLRPAVTADNGDAHGVWFSYLNFNKSSVAFDPADAGQRSALAELVRSADVVISSLSPRQCTAFGLDLDGIREEQPGLVVTEASWFGPDGPYAEYLGSDSICHALAGAAKLVGPREGPPVTCPDYQSAYFGGLYIYIATLASLSARLRDGHGRSHAVSVHEATIALSEYQVADAWEAGKSQVRDGISRFAPTFPAGVYPCREGLLGVTLITPAQWASFCTLIGRDDLARHPVYSTRLGRYASADILHPILIERLRTRTAEEWFADSMKLRLPIVVVPSMKEVLATQVFRDHRRIVPITDAGGTRLEAPGPPLNLTATPPLFGGVVRRPDRGGLRWQRSGGDIPAPGSAGAAPLPLEGVRIVDLTMGWAGPLCTRNMADLGAEVIKVEACRYPDWWRGTEITQATVDNKDYEKIARFNLMNRNKKAITLDLTQPAGVALLKELVRTSDALVENYSASVLRKLGLPYEVLREVNPSLVMVSMSAYGSSGPWSEVRAYGTTLEHGSGLSGLSGREGEEHVVNHVGYGDPIGGLNSAAALLTALLHRQRTGNGQYVDMALVECMLPLVAPWVMLQSSGDVAIRRNGSRHPEYVPNGFFRCRGNDAWIAASILDDAMWRNLCRVIDREDLSGLGHAERRAREDEIEEIVSGWTAGRTPDEAMRILQDNGVAAGAVRSPYDLLSDPQLEARAFWQYIDRPHIGTHPQASPAYRSGSAPYRVRAPSPLLGQDNESVLTGILGRNGDDIRMLEQEKVIGREAHVLIH